MSFYQQLAPYYHHIFKINPAQVQFVVDSIQKKEASILDIGCGIGTLSLALSHNFKTVTGIDLDAEMVNYAVKKLEQVSGTVDFHQLGMLDISNQFPKKTFDGIVCFGNTLVHLDSLEEVHDFITQSKSILKPRGKLLIQMVNYDRILSNEIKHLPLIENDEIRFEREYVFHAMQRTIDFNTTLTVKSTQQKIVNSVLLLPILHEELNRLIKMAGFLNVNYYGNFNKEPYTIDSPALIVAAW